MVTIEDFSRLVAGIHAAAITPQQWEPALRDVVGTLDATGGGLVFADGSSRWQVGAILPPEAAQSYAEHYSRIDHVLAAVEEGPVGAVRAGGELIAAKPTTEFHADWILERADMGSLVEAETDWHSRSVQDTATLPRITGDMTSPPIVSKQARAWVETLFG